MTYLSVCSGIEAATVGWEPVGFRPVAFSEIDPFACALLAEHYPSVPNLGDMTRFEEWNIEQPDILVGARRLWRERSEDIHVQAATVTVQRAVSVDSLPENASASRDSPTTTRQSPTGASRQQTARGIGRSGTQWLSTSCVG